jgi:hypothetical protein
MATAVAVYDSQLGCHVARSPKVVFLEACAGRPTEHVPHLIAVFLVLGHDCINRWGSVITNLCLIYVLISEKWRSDL